MGYKGYKSNCKSPSCSAANPKVDRIGLEDLPKDVSDEIKKKDLHFEQIMKCSYCGDIWIEQFDSRHPATPNIIWVGLDNTVGGGGMIWKILNKKA